MRKIVSAQFHFHHHKHPHQVLDYQTPAEVCFGCGQRINGLVHPKLLTFLSERREQAHPHKALTRGENTWMTLRNPYLSGEMESTYEMAE